jgi:hypothetical protein
MFNFEMDLCSYITCLHVLELLLFIAAIISYGIYLSYMIILFRIRIFNLFKYEGSMSLISLSLKHSVEHQIERGRSGPEAGRSAPMGRTVRACAEQIRVPSFVLRLLAKIMG